MAIDLTTLADVQKTWALPNMRDAQKAFNKYPSASNWKDCLRWMMVYQQLDYACNKGRAITDKLMFDLESNPLGIWPDAICRATLGMTCADALAVHH